MDPHTGPGVQPGRIPRLIRNVAPLLSRAAPSQFPTMAAITEAEEGGEEAAGAAVAGDDVAADDAAGAGAEDCCGGGIR
jgi:hypothetical protein